MTELSDLEIDDRPAALEPELRPSPGPPPRRDRPTAAPLLIAALLIAAGALTWWIWPRVGSPAEPIVEPPPAVTSTDPAPLPTEPPVEAPPLELPPLAESDPVIARLVAALSAHPELARWLANDALVERFVAAVENVAEGKSPRTHIEFAEPSGLLEVFEQDGTLYLDPTSYARYDTATAVIASLDTQGTARLLQQLDPLFTESYARLGYPDTRFQTRLLTAIDSLLAVPIRDEPLEVTAKVRSYALADPQLEGLTAAQKHLLRMGPENARRVQAKLRAIRRALTAIE